MSCQMCETELNWSSGITAGGWGAESLPEVFHLEIYADVPRKERQGKRENGEQKEENFVKGKVEN